MILQMWFPISVQYFSYAYHATIRCDILLKCDMMLYDILTLGSRLKVDISIRLLRCGFLLIFNEIYMSNFPQFAVLNILLMGTI